MRFYVNSITFDIKYSFLLIIAFSILANNYNYLYVLLFSSLHELGHLISLYIIGGRAEVITFSYYGIALKHNSSLSWFKNIIFLLSGIMVNLAFVCLNIYRDINICLLFINALPIYPLDGGRVLKIVLNQIFGLNVSDTFFKIISFMILALIVVLAFYIKNISLIFILVYIVIYSINNSFD